MNLKQFGKMEPVNPWTKLVVDIDSEIKDKRDIMMNMPLSDVSELKAICKRIGDLEDKRGSLILAEMRVRHGWGGKSYRMIGDFKMPESDFDNFVDMVIDATCKAAQVPKWLLTGKKEN